MQPIIPIEHTAKPRGNRLNSIDSIAFLLALVFGGAVMGLAIYFFTGFVASGQGWQNLLSAFLLCMGVGLLLSLPLFAISYLARRTRQGRYSRRGLWLGLALILPWLIVSLFFLAHSALPFRYGGVLFLVSLVLTAWVMWRLIMGPTRR